MQTQAEQPGLIGKDSDNFQMVSAFSNGRDKSCKEKGYSSFDSASREKKIVIKPRLLLTKTTPSKRNVIYLKQCLLYRHVTFLGAQERRNIQALGFMLRMPDSTLLG